MAAIEPALRIAIGVSIIAQIRVFSGALASRSARAASMIVPGPSTLGSRIASGAAAIAAARSSSPQGVWAPLTRMTTSRAPNPPARTASTTCCAGGRLGVGRDGILEVEDDRVGGRVRALAIALALEPGM